MKQEWLTWFEWWHLIYLLPLVPIAIAISFLVWCNKDDKQWKESSYLVHNAERPYVESDYNAEINGLMKQPAYRLAIIAIVVIFGCAIMFVINLLTRR